MSKKPDALGREDHVIYLNMLTSAGTVPDLLKGCDLLKKAVAELNYLDPNPSLAVHLEAPKKNTDPGGELVVSEQVDPRDLFDEMEKTPEPTDD